MTRRPALTPSSFVADVGFVAFIKFASHVLKLASVRSEVGGNTLYTNWTNEHESNHVACDAARARVMLELS
jgi:hypothetical protein